MKRALVLASLLSFALLVGAPNATAANCAERLKVEAFPLHFGTITVPPGGAGIVVVGASGGVATVGQIAGGLDAQPAFIRICGPAEANFHLILRVDEANPSKPAQGRADFDVGDLELHAQGGGTLEPLAENQWRGRLGRRGEVGIRLGGTLRIGRGVVGEVLDLPYSVIVSLVE